MQRQDVTNLGLLNAYDAVFWAMGGSAEDYNDLFDTDPPEVARRLRAYAESLPENEKPR